MTGDPSPAEAVRRLAIFTTPRSDRPLWRTLDAVRRGHGSRTTTVKLMRHQARRWNEFCVLGFDLMDKWPWVHRCALLRIGVKLLLAAGGRRGKRAKRPDREIVAEVGAAMAIAKARGRSRAAAIDDVAGTLGCDPSTVRRALRRAEAHRIKLSE